ncbi:MAG: hypothetical protein K8T25_13650 [Planctomycetia bacterium]|nr:hypothetical protein [Planctomycetia bacterium]
MKKLCVMLVGSAVILGLTGGAAEALPPFKKAFEEKYVKPANNEAFSEAFKAEGCNVCHVKGKKKDIRNAYGEALAKLIEGDAKHRLDEAGKESDDAKAAEMKKILGELDAAFTKVEAEKAPDGETFGAKIKAGKLP